MHYILTKTQLHIVKREMLFFLISNYHDMLENKQYASVCVL
jgi:hypothetical protein